MKRTQSNFWKIFVRHIEACWGGRFSADEELRQGFWKDIFNEFGQESDETLQNMIKVARRDYKERPQNWYFVINEIYQNSVPYEPIGWTSHPVDYAEPSAEEKKENVAYFAELLNKPIDVDESDCYGENHDSSIHKAPGKNSSINV